MSQSIAEHANAVPSKRPFEDTTHHFTRAWLQYNSVRYALTTGEAPLYQHCPQPYSPSKRRSSSSEATSMLADRDQVMSASFPSFMSVFDGSEESTFFRTGDLGEHSKADQDGYLMTTQSANIQAPLPHSKPSEHRDSVTSLSTQSESTESSPTTTSSTFDSPLISDTSSAPESATSLAPSTPFTGIMAKEGQPTTLHNGDKRTLANTQGPQTMQDATKNVKRLTLDMNLPTLRRPATTSLLDTAHPLSCPTSPLKEPMKSARKKPTNLTIRTPGYNQSTFPRAAGNVPPTPSGRPALHHIQSSPALPSLASPRGPPAGGMFLPLPSLNTQHSKQNSSSSNGSSFLASSMPDLREESEHQLPQSQEAPERGYTEGPICIYDCGVYLYLEPTAEEASNYDTIINVAKEVRNPLKSVGLGEGTVMSVMRADRTEIRRSMTEPQTAISEFSFKSAWEWPRPENTITPATTTPTQSSYAPKPKPKSKQPEYVHVRWDHNSEILEDLYPLCKVIDERVAEGKKVLIHCQLGVSRSASLIIAYGLYKNYQPTFHAMYAIVKERSRWVGPNMSLIYQLTDFKNKLNRGDFANGSRPPRQEWFIRSPDGPLAPLAGDSTPAITSSDPAAEALRTGANANNDTNTRRTTLELNKAQPPVPLFPNSEAPTQPLAAATPTPAPPPRKSVTTVKRAASRPLPLRERSMGMEIPAHRPRKVAGTAGAQASAIMDLAMKDVPSTPSLFSPRASEFMATPFGIRGAGDLETPGNRQSKEIPSSLNWLPVRKEGHIRTASKDPRSPHQEAEAKETFGSIDEYL